MSEKKIVEYTIFYSNERPESMDLSIINKYLKEGWVPYGTPFVYSNGLNQVLVKYGYDDPSLGAI